MSMLPIAHAGHWALYVLYAVPVVIVLASVVSTLVKERRRGGDEAAGEEGEVRTRANVPRGGL
jgi:hypothetical protein